MQAGGFSDIVMDHFLHPRNAGTLPAPCGEGWSGSVESARFMRIQVHLQDGRVAEARFGTYGCAPAIAAGSYLTSWACGRPISEVQTATAQWLEEALGGLPSARRYCAELAVAALRKAISDAIERS